MEVKVNHIVRMTLQMTVQFVECSRAKNAHLQTVATADSTEISNKLDKCILNNAWRIIEHALTPGFVVALPEVACHDHQQLDGVILASKTFG
jgi:nitrate reductase beta subunit